MVRMEINTLGQKEWTEIIINLEGISLMQTWEFGEAKQNTGPWKVNRAVFKKNDDEIIGAVQALTRSIPFIKRGLVWINHAPLFRNKEALVNGLYSTMLNDLREYWVEERKMYLRVAPPIEASLNNYELLYNAGFKQTSEIGGWTSDVIDLTEPVEHLRKKLQQKWRNCLNKAERMGVSYEIGTSQFLFKELLTDYRALMLKKHMESNETLELIIAMQDILPEANKMIVLAGRHNGERLGSILIACYGSTCIYLVGATNENGRQLNVNHYLLWNALCEMKKRGYTCFDLWGVHPIKTPKGILHFKKGLNGRPYQLVGELEACRNTMIDKIIRRKIDSKRQGEKHSKG